MGRCIRAHGVPNFPDPNSQGQVNLAGINFNSPQFMASHRDCSSFTPPNGGRTPAQVQPLAQQDTKICNPELAQATGIDRPRSAEVKRAPDAAMPGGEVLPLLGANVGDVCADTHGCS